MTPAFALAAVAVLFATSVLAVALGNRPFATATVYGLSLAGSLVLLIGAGWSLLAGGTAEAVSLPLGVPWIGVHFRIDALAAFFLTLINLGAATASLYAIGYGRHEQSPGRVLPFYPAFLAGMNLVVLADDAFTFLVSWETMSLASWALVMAHHRVAENVRAGFIYIVMASFGAFALMLAFGLLAGPEGHYTFAAIRQMSFTAGVTAPVVVLALIGAGSKAGLVPLHVWLPLAHPAAPSHVSALMSGVMTKVAVYAFVRILFDLVGPSVWWWSLPVVLVGGMTAVIGILFATMQTDLKKALAYSTVENIGVIFVGLGLALAFSAKAMPVAAALAMTAALFHVFNHSLFKSLLFFGAGAVLTSTGLRDIEKLGGLIHGMPRTAILFLVGCVAIAALPPLNGFASEWLTFQAILLSPSLPDWSARIVTPAVGALLALAAALAAACFVRIFGIAFLGRPSTPAAAAARETDAFSLGAMATCAAISVAAGLLPGAFIDAIRPAVTATVGARLPTQLAIPWLSIGPRAESGSSYNGLLIAIFIVLSASIAVLAIHRLSSRAIRRGPAWGCGFSDPGPATQYTGSSFAQPIRRVFGTTLFAARERVTIPPPGDLAPAHMDVDLRDLVWDVLYAPVARTVTFAADRLNRFQFLTIRQYLSLVFAALVALLLVLAIWS